MSTPRHRRALAGAALVYVTLVLSLQIFLLSVSAEGFLADEPGLSWSASAISVVLALIGVLFYRLLR